MRKNKTLLLQEAKTILQTLPNTIDSSYETLKKFTNKDLADWIKSNKETPVEETPVEEVVPAKEETPVEEVVPAKEETPVEEVVPAKEETPSTINAVNDFAQYLQTNTDAKDYLAMCTMSGNIIIPDEMGEYERRSWLADMEAWISAGRPKAKMPEIPKGTVKIPIAIYRVRDQGKDKMMVKYTDGSFDGREEKIEYEKIEDPTTGDLVDSKTIKEGYKIYTMYYTEKLILKYTDEAAKLLKPHQKLTYYYIQNNEKVILNPQNITKSHEELASAIAEKKSIS